MNKTKKILNIALSGLFASMAFVNIASAELSSSIPASALSSKGKKVTICHFPPGNPTNYQVITISTNALNTHLDHHSDVFAINGNCPNIPKPSRWTYLDSWDPSSGKPNDLENISSAIPTGILEQLQTRLPEGGMGSSALSMLTDDEGANIPLKEEATVKIAYVKEGAGYLNSVAFFNFPTDKLTTLTASEINDKIIFPNFSDNVLQFGDAVELGEFEAGTSIGFTIISNGWKSAQGMVNESQSNNTIFHTIKGLNPESAGNNKNAHTVLFIDAEHEMLYLGFEDLNRTNASHNDYGYGSDDDFNDVIIAIKVTPFSAVIPDKLNPLNPVPVTGVSGPTNWREVNTPPSVVDPIKAAGQAIMKAKKNAKANAGAGIYQ